MAAPPLWRQARRAARFENGLVLKAIGLTLDGVYVGRSAGTGIYIYNAANNARVTRSHTFNQTNSGINVYAASKQTTGVVIEGNLIENTDPNAEPGCGSGCGASAYRTDYGIRLYRAQAVINNNLFRGGFNHGISTKESNPLITIRGNHFAGCGSWCLELGQQREFVDAPGDRTSGQAIVENNVFAAPAGDGGVKTVQIINQRTAEIRNNQFTRPAVITVGVGLGQPADRVLTEHGPLRPEAVALVGNSLVASSRIRLMGRGNPTTAAVTGNTGSGITCSIEPMRPQGPVSATGMPFRGPPVVTQASNGFTCQ